MTNPPPPGNWGPPQPGPQPPYGPGKPQYGPPPGQWPAQQGWGQPQPPKNNRLKWLLIGVAVLLVIAITIGATLLITRDDGGNPPTATGSSSAPGGIASADDSGPVTVITEDPTCEPSRPIISTLAKKQRQGWTDRDIAVPASSWTPSQRAIHDDVADAMRSAADQTFELARRTPHRVMRELYLQAIAYWHAYADAIPTYTESDNSLAVVTTDLAGAIVSICAAVDYGSARARGPFAQVGEAPESVVADINITSPEMFISADQDSICSDWTQTSRKFDLDVGGWHSIDPNLSASQWTPEQREVMMQSIPVMNQFAMDLRELGTRSRNPIVSDFAALSSAYWSAFTASIESYDTADSYLSSTANYVNFAVYYACEAAER